jgi:hypothetical protein
MKDRSSTVRTLSKNTYVTFLKHFNNINIIKIYECKEDYNWYNNDEENDINKYL